MSAEVSSTGAGSGEAGPVAFVAHSFAPEDAPVADAVCEVLREAGVSVLTGERPEAYGVGRKVRERICRSDLFVAVMTHRHSVARGRLWTTNPWVVEEKGYALGQKPERPVVSLVEEGIPAPAETGGLGGDLEIIYFNRKQFEAAGAKLRQVLAGLKV